MKEPGRTMTRWHLSGENDRVEEIPIKQISTNPFQPRNNFDEEKIKELSQSIKTYGLLQPVMVRPYRGEYQLVVGERRLLACQRLGWTNIRCVVKELSDNALATVALIENLQRENLSCVEEAEGYERLIHEFNLTQEVLAQRLGKSQSSIANKMRLLRLPDSIKEYLKSEQITERHARALLQLEDENDQLRAVKAIIEQGLNVQQAEKRINQLKEQPSQVKEKKTAKGHRGVVRDLRIFINTIRQAVNIIENAGLTPEVQEEEDEENYQIVIKLPKEQDQKFGLRKEADRK